MACGAVRRHPNYTIYCFSRLNHIASGRLTEHATILYLNVLFRIVPLTLLFYVSNSLVHIIYRNVSVGRNNHDGNLNIIAQNCLSEIATKSNRTPTKQRFFVSFFSNRPTRHTEIVRSGYVTAHFFRLEVS